MFSLSMHAQRFYACANTIYVYIIIVKCMYKALKQVRKYNINVFETRELPFGNVHTARVTKTAVV